MIKPLIAALLLCWALTTPAPSISATAAGTLGARSDVAGSLAFR